MPWTADEFKERHAKKLTHAQARKAASVANAILRSGGSDGTAIATGIKTARQKVPNPGHHGGTPKDLK